MFVIFISSSRAAVAAVLLAAVSGGAASQTPTAMPRERPVAPDKLQLVHAFRGQMPVGIAVTSTGRRFVSYPRWEDPLRFTLAELRGGREVPYPGGGNFQRGHKVNPRKNLVSLQGILVDPRDRLWVLDTGTVNMKPVQPFTPKLIGFDTRTNRIVKTITFPASVVPPGGYLNDLRIDLRRGQAGTVYITDSGKTPGIVVADIASGRSWRRLANHPSVRPVPGFVGTVEGRALFKRPNPKQATHLAIASDGIAISADGERLFYTPLASRRLYSVATDALIDANGSEAQAAATVRDHGEKGVADGMCEDTRNRIYTTNWEQSAILRRLPNGLFETVVRDPRLLWPDTLDLTRDGFLYVISNQLHRQAGYNAGRDRRERPFALWRIKTDARPVDLR